jgi:hypothetical protein
VKYANSPAYKPKDVYFVLVTTAPIYSWDPWDLKQKVPNKKLDDPKVTEIPQKYIKRL